MMDYPAREHPCQCKCGTRYRLTERWDVVYNYTCFTWTECNQ